MFMYYGPQNLFCDNCRLVDWANGRLISSSSPTKAYKDGILKKHRVEKLCLAGGQTLGFCLLICQTDSLAVLVSCYSQDFMAVTNN